MLTPEQIERIKQNNRVIQGLIKKHGEDFEISFKYLTNTGKWKKRQGQFQGFVNEGTIRLFNDGKGREAVYELEKMDEINRKK